MILKCLIHVLSPPIFFIEVYNHFTTATKTSKFICTLGFHKLETRMIPCNLLLLCITILTHIVYTIVTKLKPSQFFLRLIVTCTNFFPYGMISILEKMVAMGNWRERFYGV